MSLNNIQNIIPKGTVMNGTITSLACSLQKMYNFSITVIFTGTPNGSFKLQMSNDEYFIPNNTNPNVPVNWQDIAYSTFIVTAAGSVTWDYGTCGFNYVRVIYLDASDGVSTAQITASQFNGK